MEEKYNALNAVIIEGEVIDQYTKGFTVKNENRYGTTYLSCTVPSVKLKRSLGKDLLGKVIRCVGTYVKGGLVVEYAEFKPQEVEE